jgi:hypothetical protein
MEDKIKNIDKKINEVQNNINLSEENKLKNVEILKSLKEDYKIASDFGKKLDKYIEMYRKDGKLH